MTDIEIGLPCEWCLKPTQEVQTHIYTCRSCAYVEKKSATQKSFADPGNCNFCNP